MGQALYRKYRSKTLAEIVGQEHITDTLAKALQADRISHAYLFSGPRGVGKTSIARILAHEINHFVYDEDSTHIDIIEIDAASNRRIDEIRDLRDKVYISPTSGSYKVYIIDEVHMLTREAFNALLKTLEEPPTHVVFILATTEAHKLPETIVSRTQHYVFKPVDHDKVVGHLQHIATTEGLQIDSEALSLLARHGGGSFRDSISLLDQSRSLGSAITAADVRLLLGIAPDTAITNLISCISQSGSTSVIMQSLNSLYDQGLQASSIASQIAQSLRSGLVSGSTALPLGETLRLLERLIDVPASSAPDRKLELVLLEASQATVTQTMPTASQIATPIQPVVQIQTPSAVAPPPPSKPVRTTVETPAKTIPAVHQPVKSALPTEQSEQSQPSPTIPVVAGPVIVTALTAAIWPDVLSSIKQDYNTIYGVLRNATPVFMETGVEVQCKFAFHQKRLNEVKNKQIIADYIKRITGQDVEILCTYQAAGASQPVSATSAAPLEAISNIFGGGEVI